MISRRRRRFDDRGSVPIEAAILTPVLVLLITLAIGAGRIAMAENKIGEAAESAARQASLHRTQAAAEEAAYAAANESLSGQGLHCASTEVSVDAAGLTVPVGQVATVTVTVECTVQLTDLMLPTPGNTTRSSTFTSTIDAYRERG